MENEKKWLINVLRIAFLALRDEAKHFNLLSIQELSNTFLNTITETSLVKLESDTSIEELSIIFYKNASEKWQEWAKFHQEQNIQAETGIEFLCELMGIAFLGIRSKIADDAGKMTKYRHLFEIADLFHNVPNALKCLILKTQEYQKIFQNIKSSLERAELFKSLEQRELVKT
jgi:hypothetical protein